jgi:hypothetical protein
VGANVHDGVGVGAGVGVGVGVDAIVDVSIRGMRGPSWKRGHQM